MALLAPVKTEGGVPQGRSASEFGSSLLGATLESIDLRNMWRVVWRWRGLVLWTTLVLTALSIFVIYHLTPQYTASAQVLVGIQQVKLGNLQDLLSDLKGDNEAIATEIGIIRSRNLAEKTVAKLNLDNNPEFNPALQSSSFWARALSVVPFVPKSWIDRLNRGRDAGSASTNRDMTKIIDNFEDKLRVTSDGRST